VKQNFFVFRWMVNNISISFECYLRHSRMFLFKVFFTERWQQMTAQMSVTLLQRQFLRTIYNQNSVFQLLQTLKYLHYLLKSQIVVRHTDVIANCTNRKNTNFPLRWEISFSIIYGDTENSLLICNCVFCRGGTGREFRRIPDPGTRPLLPGRIRVVAGSGYLI